MIILLHLYHLAYGLLVGYALWFTFYGWRYVRRGSRCAK